MSRLWNNIFVKRKILLHDFLDMTQKPHATKEKIDKLDFIKKLKFCASKDNINKVRKQPTE